MVDPEAADRAVPAGADAAPASRPIVIRVARRARRALPARSRYIVYARETAVEPLVPAGPTPEVALSVLRGPADVHEFVAWGGELDGLPHCDDLDERFAGGNRLVLLLAGQRAVHSSWLALAPANARFDPVLEQLPTEKAGYIGPCFTHPDWRGRGLYGHALREICRYLARRDIRRAYIDTSDDNVASRRAIGRAGFEPRFEVRRLQLLGWQRWRWRVVTPWRDGRVVWFKPRMTQSGGGERIALEAMEFFRRRDIPATLVAFEYDRQRLFDGRYAPEVVVREESGPPVRGPVSGLLHMASRVRWLRRTLHRLRPTIVVTHGTWGQATELYLATLFTPYRYAVHVYGSVFALASEVLKYGLVFRRHFNAVRSAVPSYAEATAARRPAMRLRKRLSLEAFALLKWLSVRRAVQRFTLSRRNQWEVARLYGKPAVVLKGAFPHAIFAHAPAGDVRTRRDLAGRRVVLGVSRLVDNKRIDVALRGFALLADDPDLVFLVGGTGPEEDSLRRLARALGVGDRVRFLGHVPEDELRDLYAAADVFVSMDLADFDIAPYEALAMGCAVVWATDMETDPALQRYPRLFAAEPTPADVARMLRRALAAPPVADRAAVLGRYSWESFFSEMLEHVAV